MQKFTFPVRLFTAVLFLSACMNSFAAKPAEEMVQAAQQWLGSLNDEQRALATFEFKDEERENWHYIPKDRPGLSLKDMTAEQSQLAMALLAAGLSREGIVKAATIMSLEKILQELEGPNRRFPRDPALYHVSIFGKPKPDQAWGWRVEGHHLSINFTVAGNGTVAGTPSFMGTNPAKVLEGPRKGLRALAEEEDLGLELVQSLSAEQKEKAVFQADAPPEILTGAARTVEPLDKKGLRADEMNESQRELLSELVKSYLRRNRPALADWEYQKILEAGWREILFAWAGPTTANAGNYYRVQGSTFLLEYDNTQNNNNHVHAVWRDFKNDFGRDYLKEHYQSNPHP